MAINFPASPSIGQIHTDGGATFIWNGTKWKAVAVNAPVYATGGIEVYVIDANTLGIRPVGHGMLIIDGQARAVVPTTLAATLFDANQNRYLYAYWTGSAIAYEVSATSHTTHASGTEIKAGDPTRSIIAGIVKHTSGLVDSLSWRGVANWFNRKLKSVAMSYPQVGLANSNTTAMTSAAYGWVWAGCSVIARNDATVLVNVAAQIAVVSCMIDGALSGYHEGHTYHQVANAYQTTSGVSWSAFTTSLLHSIQGSGRCTATGVYTMTTWGSVSMELLI